MYDVLWFERGNDLKKRACFYYKKPAIDLAKDWFARAIGERDSVQVYDDGKLIWVDEREVFDDRLLSLDRPCGKLRER